MKKVNEISGTELIIVFAVTGLVFWFILANYQKFKPKDRNPLTPTINLPAVKPAPKQPPSIKPPVKRRRYPQWHFRKRGKQSPVFEPEELKIPSPNPCKRCPSIPT